MKGQAMPRRKKIGGNRDETRQSKPLAKYVDGDWLNSGYSVSLTNQTEDKRHQEIRGAKPRKGRRRKRKERRGIKKVFFLSLFLLFLLLLLLLLHLSVYQDNSFNRLIQLTYSIL